MITEIQKEEVFAEGFIAYFDGYCLDENPYEEESEFFDHWVEGFYDASKENI